MRLKAVNVTDDDVSLMARRSLSRLAVDDRTLAAPPPVIRLLPWSRTERSSRIEKVLVGV